MTIADRLSGTIGSAKIAAAQYSDKRVVAINSNEAGPSALMFLREMVKAQQAGATMDELLAFADELKDRIAMQFIPASLTELARGGRVNKLLSRLGNILKIKPVFEFAKTTLRCTPRRSALTARGSGDSAFAAKVRQHTCLLYRRR